MCAIAVREYQETASRFEQIPHEGPMPTHDGLSRFGVTQKIWQKYCGFLDLSLADFMEIQEHLLLEQLSLVSDSQLGRKILGASRPATMDDFRGRVPITTYADYQPYLGERQEAALAEKPLWWVYTSAQSGSCKWAPFTERAVERLLDTMMGSLILAAASRKGEVNIQTGARALFNMAPRPYLAGYLTLGMAKRFDLKLVPPADIWESMEFEERIEQGFKLALRTGVDIMASMSSVLVKTGQRFEDHSSKMSLSSSMLHPQVLSRLTKAALTSKIHGRHKLPKDLWSPKCLVCWGTDTSIYRKDIARYWGKQPYEFYARTEAGIAAVQGWKGQSMTFVPFSQFFEFIPEEDWLKFKDSKTDQPPTVLMDQLQVGRRYLPVITSFYGMPFLRYLLGDIIKVVSLADVEAGIKLPQMVYEGRVDDIIDIAGFAKLDEKTVWQAIANSNLPYQEWTVRKEYADKEAVLHLYLELSEEAEPREVCHLIHEQLKALDPDYLDLEKMLGIRPLRVTLLSRGTFRRYYREKQAAGLDLTQLKPPHMNAPSAIIKDVLRLSRNSDQ